MAILPNLFGSLRSRILALVLGLVALVLMAAIVGMDVTERAETQRQVGAQIQMNAGTAQELLRFRDLQLATGVGALALDAGFRQAVGSADAAALASAIENQQRRITADLGIVLSPNGRPLASTFNGSLAKAERDLERLIVSGTGREVRELYRLIDGRPYQLVIAPILDPAPNTSLGWGGGLGVRFFIGH